MATKPGQVKISDIDKKEEKAEREKHNYDDLNYKVEYEKKGHDIYGGTGQLRIIDKETGKVEIKMEGTGSQTWLTNNVMLIPSSIGKQFGAIGEADGVAVFRTPEEGMRAFKQLSQTEPYKSMSVKELFNHFQSEREKATGKKEQYQQDVTDHKYPNNKKTITTHEASDQARQVAGEKRIDIDMDAKVGDLSNAQLGRVMRVGMHLKGEHKQGTVTYDNVKSIKSTKQPEKEQPESKNEESAENSSAYWDKHSRDAKTAENKLAKLKDEVYEKTSIAEL